MTKSKWYQFYIFNPVRKVGYYATYLLDEGGFGQVWSGVSTLGLRVAIKIIKRSDNFLRDWQSWINEQRILLLCLEHPHIVTTFDQFCSPEGHLVLVMEKAAGSLDHLISADKPLDPLSVCIVGTQICSALHHIHNLGVVHRDVTLKNILWFPDGTFKLSDFGISKPGISAEELALTFIGHRTFIPPELLVAGYSTHQSDIYQLGLVLLTLLTGSYPIPANATVEQTRQMILEGAPRQTAERLISKHGKLAEIISVMLRRRHRFRYKTVMAVWRELYDEFRRRNRIREIVEFWKKQPPSKVLPWLRHK